MLVTLLKAKLHRATVTQADLHYEGSVSIDADLLAASGILPHEQVDIYNITNGQRFTTYAIRAAAGSRAIQINGAAARLTQPGDRVIICAYATMTPEEAAHWQPMVILLGENNLVQSAGHTDRQA